MSAEIEISCQCPCCGAFNDRMIDATNRGRLPHDGDITICIWCAFVGVFERNGMDLTVRLPNSEEEEHFKQHPEIAWMQQMIRQEIENGRDRTSR